MKVTIDQLSTQLKKQLAPLYLVSSDEQLLLQEAQQLIRHHATQQGYTEYNHYTLTASFDWQLLWQRASNMSLFSDRQLIELSMPNGKPGESGAKQLMAYADKPLPDTILLITSSKIDSSSQRSKWYKTLLDKSVVVPIWPIERHQLPQWIKQRLQQAELQCDAAALNLLAERVEGNLLAAAQEIEKLRLLYGPGKLTLEQITTAVTDNSRFDVFKLTDSILRGEKNRVQHMLQGLRDEGTDPTLVLWAISREYRLLAQISHGLSVGKSMKQCASELGVWESRHAILQRAVSGKPPSYFHRLLHKAHEIDCMIKGAKAGDPWLGLLALSVVESHPRLTRPNK